MTCAWILLAALVLNVSSATLDVQDPDHAAAGASQTASDAGQTQPSSAAEPVPNSPTLRRKRRAGVKQGEGRKRVIRQGSTPEATAQLAPGMSEEQANQQRQDTEQLLTTSESGLTRLEGRKMNAQDQETVSQIRNYMAGARSALKENDPQRAHTLALKAHLLVEEIEKH